MTTNMIEHCAELEKLETTELFVSVESGMMLIVFDPYIINSKDLERLEPGPNLIRVRRPGWGRANVKDCIHVIRI